MILMRLKNINFLEKYKAHFVIDTEYKNDHKKIRGIWFNNGWRWWSKISSLLFLNLSALASVERGNLEISTSQSKDH